MGSEDVPQTQSHADEAGVAAQLRQLNARVEQLEREVASLRAGNAAAARVQVAPPPPPRQIAATAADPVKILAETPSVVQMLPQDPILTTAPPSSLENRLGAQIFNRIGIIALLCAAALGLKLAIDNQWIGPVGRVLIGLVAGAGVIIWSERFRRRGFAVFSYSLKAVGTGVLYLSLWAAFQIYHLLPDWAALAGMVLVTAWNAYMAWVQDAELLAAYALAGGLATPLLLSTGGDHEVFLFTYLLAIDVAAALLVRLKSWARLLLMAFPATVVYFIGWYSKFYEELAFAATTVFVGLFFLVFVSISLGSTSEDNAASLPRRRSLGSAIRDILLPLSNAAFVSLALYSIMQASERHWFLPWLMLILAAVYLLITKLTQGAVPAAMHLSLAVVFLTIAIPLKASGHWITVAWLIEGVALLWVASRVSVRAATEEQRNSGALLRWLSAGSFVLGLGALISSVFWFGGGAEPTFFNHHFATALIGVGAFAGAVWLSLCARAAERAIWQEFSRFALAAMVAVCGIAVLVSLREIMAAAGWQPHTAFANAEFGMALTGIAILAVVARVSVRLALEDESTLQWAPLAAGAVIAINVVAVLSGVREVRALWPVTAPGSDLELQRSLAVSGFLMVYGAILLAIGFWRRSSFVRWQALVLLVFSIAKTFVYDMRNLSQGYRFVSFLALGALLMVISFAYQKDWLALRDTGSSDVACDPEQRAGQ